MVCFSNCRYTINCCYCSVPEHRDPASEIRGNANGNLTGKVSASDMIDYFYSFIFGVFTGIISAISFGPAFLTITETSLKQGFLQGSMVSIGISLSDIMYVTLVSLGLGTFLCNDFRNPVIGLFGGLLLIAFGLSFFYKKNIEHSEVKTENGLIKNIAKGFLVNTMNMYVPVYWAGIAAVASSRTLGVSVYVVFFAGVLSTMVSLDILKSWLASRARLIERLSFRFVYQTVGGLLFLFGAQMIFNALVP